MTMHLKPWSDATLLGTEPRGIEASNASRVFGSPVEVREAAVTVLSMVGTAVNDLWELKTGRRQAIFIDTQHAELAMGSAWLLRMDGEPATTRHPMAPSPVEGVFECGDGRLIFLLCAFPSIVQATLDVLGCEPDRESVAAAIRERSSEDLERALGMKGLTGVVVRSLDEWRSHPQGVALREQPVVHLEKLDDSPPVPTPSGPRPLSGVRILDATRVIAGPMASRTLAEFGADVLQVGAPTLPDLIATEADTAHGKRRCTVDLDTPAGVETFKGLARDADVVIEAFRGGSFSRRGLGPAELARERPGLIYLSETAYGESGPWATKRGFDGNVQAASGFTDVHARAGFDAPSRHGLVLAINDYCTGYWGAYGVLEALRRRAVEGGSWHVRVSLAQTMTWVMRPPQLSQPEEGLPVAAAAELFRMHSEDVASPYGKLRRLKPVLQLAETPVDAALTTVLPGAHQPAWV